MNHSQQSGTQKSGTQKSGTQKIEFVFRGANSLPHSDPDFRLEYEVLPGQFRRRWVASLLSSLGKGKDLSIRCTGSFFADEVRDREAIERACQVIFTTTGMEIYSGKLPMFASAKDLKPLLSRCQAVLDHHQGGSFEAASIRDLVSGLIRTIALYESLYAPDHHFHCDLFFVEEQRFCLEKEDFELFTPDRNDGWLYLDYGQTGLPPFAAYLRQSEIAPEPQNSFLTNCQILYRDTHEYTTNEKRQASLWIADRMRRKNPSSLEAIGQIPIARPVHSLSREAVLERLVGFNGSVSVEIFEDDRVLSPQDLKGALKNDLLQLRRYHRLGLLGLLIDDSRVHLHNFIWHVLFPATRPFRKIYYFGSYVINNFEKISRDWGGMAMVLLRRAAVLLTLPFHRARPVVWKFAFQLSWPARKLIYFANYAITNHEKIARDWGGMVLVWIRRIWSRLTIAWSYVRIGWCYLLKPLHWIRPCAWAVAFNLSWPLRKAYYFSKYVLEKYVWPSRDKVKIDPKN